MSKPIGDEPEEECAACREKPATHRVSISVTQGLDWLATHGRQTFSVTYNVCKECVHRIVEVKVNANLTPKGTKGAH